MASKKDEQEELGVDCPQKLRRGLPRWVLRRLATGDKVLRITLPKPATEFYGAVSADGEIYWRQLRKLIPDLARVKLITRIDKKTREDGSSVETFDLTADARKRLRTFLLRPIDYTPPETFASEAAVVTVLRGEQEQRLVEHIAYAKQYEEQMRAIKNRRDVARHAMQEAKLSVELVPSPLWDQNLRKFFNEDDWDTVRTYVYSQSNHYCLCCGARSFRLHCHEVWEHDDKNHVQRLAGCRASCEDCHNIKHIRYSGIRAQEGKLDFEALIAHYCRVNECDRETFNEHFAAAMSVWSERSKHNNWTVDWSAGAELLDVAKQYVGDRELPPSRSRATWLRAYSESGNYPDQTERGGKWLIFSSPEEHDARWETIKKATCEGKLGGSSKASTTPQSDRFNGALRCVICVYSYDGDDEADVMRVREALRELGIIWVIYWKADAATQAGLYANQGHRNVSRYKA